MLKNLGIVYGCILIGDKKSSVATGKMLVVVMELWLVVENGLIVTVVGDANRSDSDCGLVGIVRARDMAGLK